MTEELSFEDIMFVDEMAGKILSASIKDPGSLNPSFIGPLAQSSYRAALEVLKVRKEYVTMKESEPVSAATLAAIGGGVISAESRPTPSDIKLKAATKTTKKKSTTKKNKKKAKAKKAAKVVDPNAPKKKRGRPPGSGKAKVVESPAV